MDSELQQARDLQPTERFSSRADDYERYRPGYPAAAIDHLLARTSLPARAQAADVGSGTGIMSELLLARGLQVAAIEPNAAMRRKAETRLGREPGFSSHPGSAERTGLSAGSVDLWIAAQAFHWFDVLAARREALRVLRTAGWVALIWNERPDDRDAFLDDYERLLQRYAADYQRLKGMRHNAAAVDAFFGRSPERSVYGNAQRLDFGGLRGRLMSSSYAPQAGSPAHEPLMRELAGLFAHHQSDGYVEFPYETRLYLGRVSPD